MPEPHSHSADGEISYYNVGGIPGQEWYAQTDDTPIAAAGHATFVPLLSLGGLGTTPDGWTDDLTGPIGRIVTARFNIVCDTGHTGWLTGNVHVGGMTLRFAYDLTNTADWTQLTLVGGLNVENNQIYVNVNNESTDTITTSLDVWFQELNVQYAA